MCHLMRHHHLVFSADCALSSLALSCSTPECLFRFLFTEELIDEVLYHTNCYILQKGFHFTITHHDILGYIWYRYCNGNNKSS